MPHFSLFCTIGQKTDLFGTKGYLETSMDDIANSARMTKGGIYYYFRTKKEILSVICSAFTELKLRGLEEILTDRVDSTERIRRAIVYLVNHYAENGRAARIVLNESRYLPQKRRKIIGEKERRCLEIVCAAIADSLALDSCNKIVTALNLTLFSMVDGICLRFDPRHNPAPDEFSRLVLELFMEGARKLVEASFSLATKGRTSNG